MDCIPTNIDWQKLALAFFSARIKPDTLSEYNITKDMLYRLRKGEQPSPRWASCTDLWRAAQERLLPEEIEKCIS